MLHKIGVGKKSIDIEIGGEIFPISFVSIYARKMAGELFEGIAKLSEILHGDDSEKEKQEALENILLCREEAIQAILEGNRLDYVPGWWEKNTDYQDQNEFLRVCLTKDVVPGKKKATVKASEK